MNIKHFFSVLIIAFFSLSLNAQVVNESNDLEPRSETFIVDATKEWELLGGGISRKVMGYDKSLMLVQVKFEKGAIGAAHKHIHAQSTFVVSGKFEFTVNGVTKIVTAGDGLYIAPDLVHGCVCLEPGILIDSFSPMRKEFVKKD